MKKKAWFALTAAIVVLAGIVFFPKVSRFVCYRVKQMHAAAEERAERARREAEANVPLEVQIERTENALAELAQDDDRHFHRVAEQRVEVKKAEAEVEAVRKALAPRESRIKTMVASLNNQDKFVTYAGKNWNRDALQEELRIAARSFQAEERRLEAMEKGLAARKRNLAVNETKLAELRTIRAEMKAELEQMKADLADERQLAATEKRTIDDGKYLETRKKLDQVRDRIDVLREKRKLRTEMSSNIANTEEEKKKQEETDAYIKDRFHKEKQ